MNKPMKKAIAAILAVLMVLCSMPFTAFAAQLTDEYINSFTDFKAYGDDGYLEGDGLTISPEREDEGSYIYLVESKHDVYYPVIHFTVSQYNSKTDSVYGQKGVSFNDLEAQGKILDPSDLKEGQIIAVAVEFSGVDCLFAAQYGAYYDKEYLQPGSYGRRNWEEQTTSGSNAVVALGSDLEKDDYTTYFTGSGLVNPSTGRINSQLISSLNPVSIYLTNNLSKITNVGTFGGIFAIYSFKVLKDCDLRDVWTYDDAVGTGTYLQAYHSTDYEKYDPDNYADNNYMLGATQGHLTYSWENVSAEEPGPAKHKHSYTQEKTPATCTEPGKITYKCSNEDGQCDRPEYTETDPDARTPLGHDYTSPECVVTPNNDGAKHTVQCLRYDQCGTTQEVECTPVPDTDKNKEASSCRPDGGGWEGATKCEVCGQVLNAGQATAPKAHTPTDDTEKNKPATCTDAGWENATKCEVCGETINEGQEIPALNHDYTEGKVIKGTDGVHHTVQCVRYDECGSTQEVECTWNQTDAGSDPTYDTPGKQPTYTCQYCGQTKGGETIPALQGVSVTVKSSDLGTSTVQGQDVTDADVTVKVAPNSEVKLKATPKDGAEFVAWIVNGKVVSTEAEHTFTALTNITFEPVFREVQEETFTVVFADMYGNIYNTQTVSSGTEVETPAGPVIAGYTFTGWSLTDEQIDALTEATTIIPKYERDTEKTFTVTATGATITTPYATTQDTNTGIGYNTKVTVTAEGAKAWKIDGVTVAYGETYEFYIGSDVVLTFETGAVTETPVVAAISVTEIGAPGALKASFLASRQMTKDATYIRAGFIYGLDPSDENLTLGDVDETSVRAYYCSTNAEQFALNVGRKEQTGKIVARAFLAYSKDGATQVVYAEPQSYTYD